MKLDILKKKKEITCLKILLQLLMIYFLQHQSFLSSVKEKIRTMFCCTDFTLEYV